MDVEYTAYEDSLTKESQSEGFWAAVTNAALTGTGALIPVAQTTRLLSGIAAGLTTVDQAYNKQFLYNKAVQILQSQMRAKRAEVQSQVIARSSSSVTEYPLGMAMADLEEYYRAGTLASAFIELSESVSTDANKKKEVKELLKGGGAAITAAQIKAGIITNVNAPLPKPLRSPAVVSPTRLGDEPQMQSKDIASVQRTLCIDETGNLGVAGSKDRMALSDFLAANGLPRSTVLTWGILRNIQDLQSSGKRGSLCKG